MINENIIDEREASYLSLARQVGLLAWSLRMTRPPLEMPFNSSTGQAASSSVSTAVTPSRQPWTGLISSDLAVMWSSPDFFFQSNGPWLYHLRYAIKLCQL